MTTIQKTEDEARAAVALMQRGASTEWPQYPSEWENLERTAKKLSKALADRRDLIKAKD